MLIRIEVDASSPESLSAAIDAMERVWAVADRYLNSYEVVFSNTQSVPQIVATRLSVLSGNVYVDDETRLFLTTVQSKEVAEHLRGMVRRVVAHNHAVGKYKVVFVDDERPFASHAAWALAMHNKADIALYVDFLKTLDLEHEVEEFALIEQVLTAHGWCDETVALAAARVMTCCGQHGIEQIARHFREQRDTPLYKALLKAIAADSEGWRFADDHMKLFYEALETD